MTNEQIGLRGSRGESPVLREVAVDVRLQSLVQETAINQTFRNDSGHNIEAVYTFPLPNDAVLLDMVLTLGERVYRGTVVGRQQAEAQYEEAIEQGDSAFRLQKLGDGLYSASLGNLMAGETAVIGYRYAMTLAWQGNELALRVPATVAPRYGEPTHLAPYQRPEADLLADCALRVSVAVYGELARAAFTCPTHRVTMTPGDDCVSVTLAMEARLDRDFVLMLTTGAQHAACVLAPDGDQHVALLSCAPQAGHEDPAPRSVVLLIDCSGSMAGDSIRQAKEALHRILERLRPVDSFNIIAFGSEQKLFAAHTMPASTSIAAAHVFVDALDADLGGTELGTALERALTMPAAAPACDILLVTDGEVWLDDHVFERTRAAGRRVFTVGVGSAVAEDVVRRLAACSGGACELVTPNDDMAPRIARHFARIYQRRLNALRARWPGEAPLWEAGGDEALFSGDTWSRFAGFASAPYGIARVEVEIEGEGCQMTEIALALSEAHGLAADTLPRLAAAARLKTLSGEEATRLALDYQLVTDSTDYLIVVQRQDAEKSKGMPQLHIVPTMLAAGWGGTGSVHAASVIPAVLRRGATNAAAPRMHADPNIDYCMSVADFDDLIASLSPPSPEQTMVGPQAFIDAVFAPGTQPARTFFRKRAMVLPTSLGALPLEHLPDELVARLRELMTAGHPEDAVVLALLLVLRERLGAVLPAEADRALDQAILKVRPDRRLRRRIEAVLRDLADPQWQIGSDDPTTSEAAAPDEQSR